VDAYLWAATLPKNRMTFTRNGFPSRCSDNKM